MMQRIIARARDFSRQLSNEPEAVRRRWARAFFWGSLPIVILAWWLSLHYSLVERTAFDTARSAASSGKVAAADVLRGFSHLKTAFVEIRNALNQEFEEEAAPSDTPATERFTLPIAE